MRRPALFALAALFLSAACSPDEAQGPPQTAPPPPAAPREWPRIVQDLVPASPEPAASAQPAETKPPDPPPQPLVWRKVDLGKSSAVMPEPIEETGAGHSFDAGKSAKSEAGFLALTAGDGTSSVNDEALVFSLMEKLALAAFPLSGAKTQRRTTEVGGISYVEWTAIHPDGARTVGRVKIWPPHNYRPHRVAWRIAASSSPLEGDDARAMAAFLESMGPFPPPKQKPSAGTALP